MTRAPQDIAEDLWQLLEKGDRAILRQPDCPLINDLRASLGLPEAPQAETPLTIPARSSRAAIILEAHGNEYAVRPGSSVELPVEIGTRKGVVVVDPDDPLARVRRSISGLEDLKFSSSGH
jgi:hypothetical protein